MLAILSGTRAIARCSKDDQLILNRLLTNNKSITFPEEYTNEEIPDLYIAILIKEQPYIFIKYIHTVIADRFFSAVLDLAAKMIPCILENITTADMVTLLTLGPTYEVMARIM